MKVVLFLALLLLFKAVLPADMLLRLLPSSTAHGFAKDLLQWILPAIVVVAFMSKSRLAERYTPGFARPCLIAALVLHFGFMALLYASRFVEGGGASFVVAQLSIWVLIPVRVLLLTGLMKVFTSLQPADPA